MCAEHRSLTLTVVLLLLSGVLCQWKVEYPQKSICAVKNSSVVIQCSFYYPEAQTVTRVMWGHVMYHIFNGPFLYDSVLGNKSSRFEYVGNTIRNCSLKIHRVGYEDSGEYAFRFETNSEGGKWTGKEGPKLEIVDLKAVVTKTNGNRTMKEGDSVNLTCINSCDGGNFSSAFTWFKNGEPINGGPVFYLRNISSTNSGNYTCSLTTRKETTSGVINIDVEYGPKNTSGSVRPLTEVDAGSNITLTCSSHANPPVENYTWFKIVGDDDITRVGNKAELHIREVFPGRYFCTATNKHGSQNSSTVILKVKVSIPHGTFTRDAFIVAAVTVLVIVTVVVVIRRFNKKRTRAPETYCEEEIQSATYINWPMSDNSKSHERNMSEETTIGVIYAAVDFNTKGKSNMQQQQMDSNYDDEGVIYSTVCRDQILKTS